MFASHVKFSNKVKKRGGGERREEEVILGEDSDFIQNILKKKMTVSAGKRKRIRVRGSLRAELDPIADTSVP